MSQHADPSYLRFENDHLRTENERLKARVEELEHEKSTIEGTLCELLDLKGEAERRLTALVEGVEKDTASSMDNVLAWRLGEVAREAGDLNRKDVGDLIDRGLILRRLLEEKGFVIRALVAGCRKGGPK